MELRVAWEVAVRARGARRVRHDDQIVWEWKRGGEWREFRKSTSSTREEAAGYMKKGEMEGKYREG